MLDRAIIRETVKGVLLTFAHVEYHLGNREARPGELYCQWLDDLYHPDDAAWRSFFSEAELGGFEEFTETLNRHSEAVGERSLSAVLGTTEWNEVCQSAREALKKWSERDP